jgi:signal transduction histidine kinase
MSYSWKVWVKNISLFQGRSHAFLKIFLGTFLVLGLFAQTSSFAQDKVLILDDMVSNISGVPYLAAISDPKSQLTVSQVLDLYEQGKGVYKDSSARKLGFGIDGTPSWFILKLVNRTENENFVFSLSDGLYGTQGALEEFIVYGEGYKKTGASLSLETSYFRFNAPKDSEVILLLYLDPADYWPVILTPRISTDGDFFIRQDQRAEVTRSTILFLLGIGLAVLGGIVLKNYKVIPYFLGSLIFCILVITYQFPSFQQGVSEILYPFLLFLTLLSIGVGTVLQNALSLRDKNELVSIGVPLGLSIISMVIVFLLPEGFGLMNVILLNVPAFLLCLSFSVLSLAFYQEGDRASLWNALMWFFLSLTFVLYLLSGFEFFYDMTLLPVSLPYTSFSIAILFLLVTVFTIPADHMQDISVERSLFSGQVKNLKEAEEEGEYNRLLTVVERERQMMAELRQIDARRRKEMQTAKESADEANRAKSAFLAVISHEIRTPMTGIMGLVRMLMDTPLTRDQQNYAKSIMESGESMTLLLNDILDFEKIETGKMTLESTDFDVRQVAQSTATLMAGHAQNKNIFLTVKVDPHIPRTVKADPSRLKRRKLVRYN